MAQTVARCIAAALAGMAVLMTGWMLAIHVLGVIHTPYMDVMGGRCLPELVGRQDLCADVNLRAVRVDQAPEQVADLDFDVFEVTGPVTVVVSLHNPTLRQRLVYQAPGIIGWGATLACELLLVGALFDGLRRVRALTQVKTVGALLTVAGFGLIAVEWVRAEVLLAGVDGSLQRESLDLAGPVLASTAGLFLIAVAVGASATARMREDLRGLV